MPIVRSTVGENHRPQARLDEELIRKRFRSVATLRKGMMDVWRKALGGVEVAQSDEEGGDQRIGSKKARICPESGLV